jgi:hypothetical protein
MNYKRIAVTLQLIALLLAPAVAQEAGSGTEVLTRGEALMKISATDFVRRKIGELLSWTVGYDISKVNRVKLTPTINYIKAVPKRVPPDGRTILELQASVDDPGGLNNIAGVRADLSSIGRLANTMLVDNGLFGDTKSGDGIYTLQTSVSPQIDIGPKDVPVAVANKKGWLALAKTTLEIKKNPVIMEAKMVPDRLPADGKSLTTLTIKIDNPGRVEDLKNVTVDLRALGFNDLLPLRNDGQQGDKTAVDDIFTLQFAVPRGIKAGEYSVRVGVANIIGGYASEDVILRVN